MNYKQRSELNKILNDKISGSSEILARLNKLLINTLNDIKRFQKIITIVQKELNHFAVIENYCKDLENIIKQNEINHLKQYLLKYSELENRRYQKIAKKLEDKISRCKKIVTISRSGTFLNIMPIIDPKRKIDITVLESRPENEGRSTAKELLSKGFKVKIITDAMMAQAVQSSDAAVSGADSVLKNGNVINKSGSLPLAIICRKYKKPYYVVVSKSKFTTKKNFKPVKKKPEAIWHYMNRKLLVENNSFEEIDRSLITSIITG